MNNAPLNFNDPLGLDPQEQGGHGAPRNPGDPVPPPHTGPGGMIEEGIAKTPAEVMPHTTPAGQIAGRALPVAGGLGELAPPLYYYVEKKNERDRQIQDICCETKMGCCERPPEEPPEDPNGDPNDSKKPGHTPYGPYDPNNPYGPDGPGPDGNYPLGRRKN